MLVERLGHGDGDDGDDAGLAAEAEEVDELVGPDPRQDEQAAEIEDAEPVRAIRAGCVRR